MSDLVVTGGTPQFTILDGFMAQVAQGSVARLWGHFKDAAGQAVDPTSPLVDVVNPNGVVVVADVVPTRVATGVYYYDFAIANDATPGLWLVHWAGTIAGSPDDVWTPFQVVAGNVTLAPSGGGSTALTQTTIGPFTFNTLAADADGATWYMTDLAGWDSPDVNAAFSDRPGQSGLYVGDATFGGRPMVAAGVVVATTPAALGRAREALIAAMDIDQPIRVQRNGPGNDATAATYADAWRADKLRIRQGGPLHFAFEVPLTAPDHRRHAATLNRIEVTDATVQRIRNAGSTSASPVLHVRGPTTNPLTVTKGAKVVRLNVALTSTDLLVVDFGRRLVTLNGVLRSDLVAATSQWFELDGDPHNLLTATQADFEDGTNGWENHTNATLEHWNGGLRGRKALAMRATGAGTAAVRTPTAANGFPVVAGRSYAAELSIFPVTTVRDVFAELRFWNALNVELLPVTGPSSFETAAEWNRRTVTGAAPLTAVTAALVAVASNGAAAEYHLVDQAAVREGTTPAWTPGGANRVTIAGIASGGRAWLSWREAWA